MLPDVDVIHYDCQLSAASAGIWHRLLLCVTFVCFPGHSISLSVYLRLIHNTHYYRCAVRRIISPGIDRDLDLDVTCVRCHFDVVITCQGPFASASYHMSHKV